MRGRVLRAEVDVEVADALFARLDIHRAVVISVPPDVAVHQFAPCGRGHGHHFAPFWSPGRIYCAPSQGDMKSNWRYSCTSFTGSYTTRFCASS